MIRLVAIIESESELKSADPALEEHRETWHFGEASNRSIGFSKSHFS